MRVSPWVVAAVAMLLVATWSVAAVLMSTRGFDISDEGYYVLSYRDWDTNLRTFTGSQYVYGPVFDLVGQSVPGLRRVRLVTVLAAHVAFAWAFVTWLLNVPQGAGLTRGWCWAAGLSIVASGGVVYGWLPLSPGYNDVSVLGTLLLMAAVLRVARGVTLHGRVPLPPLATMGPVVMALLLAKSVAGLPTVIFVLAVMAAVALRARARARGALVGAAVLLLSLGLAAAVVDRLVMPFGRMLPPMRTVNALVAGGTNSPLQLLGMYLGSTAKLLLQVVVILLVPSLIVTLGLLVVRVGRRRAGLLLLAAAGPVGLLLRWPGRAGMPPAGAASVLGYATALTSLAVLVLAVLGAGGLGARRRDRGAAQAGGGVWIVVAALAVLPAVQALGTGNELYVMAVNQIACWVALMVLGATSVRGRRVLFVPVMSATAVTVLVAATVGVDGLLEHPYRTDPFRSATRPVGGPGVLAELKVSPERAAGFDRLLGVAGGDSVRPVVLAFDEMPGLVLLLGARTPGEAWYSASDRDRTAAGIRSSCALLRDRNAPPPIAVFNRAPSPTDRSALRDCGIVLTADPVHVRLVGQPDVMVFFATRE
ncbi:hypothetical protein GCM10027080_02020 [Pedococcus soli]